MDLAKQTVDVGIFTNNLEAMQEFYGKTLGLPFESVMPVGGGFKQHRYLGQRIGDQADAHRRIRFRAVIPEAKRDDPAIASSSAAIP